MCRDTDSYRPVNRGSRPIAKVKEEKAQRGPHNSNLRSEDPERRAKGQSNTMSGPELMEQTESGRKERLGVIVIVRDQQDSTPKEGEV